MQPTVIAKPLRAVLAAALALGGAVAAQAQSGVVNIQFLAYTYNAQGQLTTTASPTFTGTGVYSGDTGTNWNGLLPNPPGSGQNSFVLGSQPTGFTSLKDSQGTTTTVGFQFDYPNAYYVGANYDPGGSSNPVGTGPGLFGAYAYMNSTGDQFFHLTGLTSGTTYSLYIYGVADTSNQTSSFTVTGPTSYSNAAGKFVATPISGPQSTGGTSGALRNQFYGPGTTNQNYVVFSGLQANTDGTLYIDWQEANSGNAAGLNGLQLVANPAPEPSQFAAFGLGVLGLGALALRARKRTAASV